MTGQVSDWLPLEVVVREPVTAAISRAVSDWSTAWFAGPRFTSPKFCPSKAERHANLNRSGWRVYRQAVATSYPSKIAGRLLGWALDAEIGGFSLSDMDRRLLAALELRLIRDLVERVETALGIEGEPRDQPADVDNPYGRLGGLLVELTDPRIGETISLAAPFTALFPACKASLPKSSNGLADLNLLSDALASVAVSVDAKLGAAKITLADLHGLAPGDVLVLDAALDEGASLSLAASNHVFASATLSDDEGDVALTLQA